MSAIPLIPFGPHATCTLDLCPLEMSVLQYRPSLGSSIAFMCIFSALLLIHSILGFVWKSWWFLGCMAVGSVTEVIGYGGRVMLFYNPFSFSGFMMQISTSNYLHLTFCSIFCIGTAPVFYSAAIYVTMAKIAENLDPSLSRIKPKLYYVVFIVSDVFSLTLQGIGGGLTTSSSGQNRASVDLSLVGLCFQVFSMVVFCGLLADYLFRYFKSTRRTINSPRLKPFLIFLTAAVLLVLARCGYRVAELSDGYRGGLISNEPLFIALDSVLIALAVLALCVGHPGFVFLPSELGLKISKISSEYGIILQNK
ncbi:RTA1-domain-containing protein [Annulohypoxylon maeteangense]|uniref:RTA1-domain-containing protein n=1 Tax=Annulohypoxylon maeteangense TaxID=1927788 RepID=UPI00200752B0|nr:RTA1-domain-containing protein [Annulohypoxylon maeteangense]KAI0880822.1 RTA1-domain-containing protein [Annulohypoxylon maeteangense]